MQWSDLYEIFRPVPIIMLACLNIGMVLYYERDKLHIYRSIAARFRPVMMIECICCAATMALVIWPLYGRPVFSYGWMHLYFADGGNMYTTSTLYGAGTGNPVMLAVSAVMIIALVAAVPFFARLEEQLFRKGHADWPKIAWQSIKFGLVHCVFAGVPLFAGLALIVPGMFYGWKYKIMYDRLTNTLGHDAAAEEATLESTVYHVTFNYMALAVGVIVLHLHFFGFI